MMLRKKGRDFLNFSTKFLIIFILSLGFISATCNEGQIDINSAKLEELDGLYGIGPSKAQSITDSRPFETIDDLINVNGIGEITLNKIKEQGLACVEGETIDNPPEEPPEDPPEQNNLNPSLENPEDDEKNKKENNRLDVVNKSHKDNGVDSSNNDLALIVPETIKLNPKGIKTTPYIENQTNERFAIYGLILFSILLISLFGTKLMKKTNNQNDFG